MVYALGSNENGKLGVGRAFHELNFAEAPIKIDTLQTSIVTAVSVGEEHSLAVTRDNRVYGWG